MLLFRWRWHRRHGRGVQSHSGRPADAATLSSARSPRAGSLARVTDSRRRAAEAGHGRAVDGVAAAGHVVRCDRRLRLVVQFSDPRPGQRVDRGHGRHERLFPRRRPAADPRTDVPAIGDRARTLRRRSSSATTSGSERSTAIRTIVGQTLRISRRDTPPTIIGVMPPNVRFLPSPGASKEPNYDVNALVDFWMPSRRTRSDEEPVLGRRRPAQGWRAVHRRAGGAHGPDAREAAGDRELDGFAPVVRR